MVFPTLKSFRAKDGWALRQDCLQPFDFLLLPVDTEKILRELILESAGEEHDGIYPRIYLGGEVVAEIPEATVLVHGKRAWAIDNLNIPAGKGNFVLELYHNERGYARVPLHQSGDQLSAQVSSLDWLQGRHAVGTILGSRGGPFPVGFGLFRGQAIPG